MAGGKQGIIVYFGQERCAYCKMLMDVNFKLPDIVKYTREHFDLIPIDIWSPEEMTDPSGRTMSQRDFSVRLGTKFTPSLVFYDADGKIALRLRGYYPPYQFRAALEYVAGRHYQREPFAVYMARGDSTLRFEPGDLVGRHAISGPQQRRHLSRLPAPQILEVRDHRVVAPAQRVDELPETGPAERGRQGAGALPGVVPQVHSGYPGNAIHRLSSQDSEHALPVTQLPRPDGPPRFSAHPTSSGPQSRM